MSLTEKVCNVPPLGKTNIAIADYIGGPLPERFIIDRLIPGLSTPLTENVQRVVLLLLCRSDRPLSSQGSILIEMELVNDAEEVDGVPLHEFTAHHLFQGVEVYRGIHHLQQVEEKVLPQETGFVLINIDQSLLKFIKLLLRSFFLRQCREDPRHSIIVIFHRCSCINWYIL